MDEAEGASSSQALPRDTAPTSAHSRAQTAAAKSQRGKGNHISALRSLGLLHELQEYVAACVETQQQQEKELGKLKAEKKDIEKALKQKALRTSEKQPCLQQFQASEISDLPPRIRALFEDNKVLKEQTRRYKQRLHEAERNAAGLEQQLLAAQSANSRLKSQLQEGDAGQEAEELAQATQQAEGLAKALEKLQHANQVLQQKLETDARLHRQAQASANKDRLQLEKQIQELQGQLEAKEKEARGNALTAKLAQRKLEEVKASAAKAVAGVNARVAEAVAAVEARHKQQEAARVHLMLCVIREPVVETKQPLSKPQVQAVQHPEAGSKGAGSIWAEDSSQYISRHAGNSSYSGKLSRDQAVLKLQAGARGYLARKQVRLQQQEQMDGLVLVQVGQQQLQDDPAAQHAAAGCAGQGTSVAACGSASNSAFGGVSAFQLPAELPALDMAPAGSISAQPSTSSVSAAGRGKHVHAPGSHAPGNSKPASRGNDSVPAPRSARQLPSATPNKAANRKPGLPVFARAPPPSAPTAARPPRQDSAAVGSARVSRSGPGGRASAAGPSILAAGLGSRAATPTASVLAAGGAGGRPGASLASSSILAAVAPVSNDGGGGASGLPAGSRGMQRTPSASRSRSRSPTGSAAGTVTGGSGLLQTANSGSSGEMPASLPLLRTNSGNSRGVAALAVPPLGTTPGPALQRTNSNSSQRSIGSGTASAAQAGKLQRINSSSSNQKGVGAVVTAVQAGAKPQQRPNSSSSRSAAARPSSAVVKAGARQGQAAATKLQPIQQQQPVQENRRQQQPPAPKPQQPQQSDATPRRPSGRLSKIPHV